ncbi:hypothetical protein KEM55_000030 [Ascosphaera atra]|nr:hypothetical protein KEM55_000030 [Ascosphaera atra]
MPIRYFDDWATARSQSLPLTVLSNSAIGIDASFYLDLHLNRYSSKEPLLPALGGFPFSLKANIERELRVLHDNGVSPVFVFKGLETECERQEVQRLETPVESARAIEHAWELYAKGDAVQVVEVFSSAGMDMD